MQSRISEYSVNAVCHAGARAWRQHCDPVGSESIDFPGDFVLLRQRVTHPGIGAAVTVTPHHQLSVHTMRGEFVGGQIDPIAHQILVDVAQKVGQLERTPSAAAYGAASVGVGFDGSQHRKHLQANDFR